MTTMVASLGRGAEAMINNDQTDSRDGEQRPERRARPRARIQVPVELFAPNSDVPLRGATADLSEIGCYIESIYPFPIGTVLDMSLQIGATVLAQGTVVTCDPQVGNGIEFSKMLPEDREDLRAFIEAAEKAE